jgi:hypothetical protein
MKTFTLVLALFSILSCNPNEYLVKCDLTEIDTNPHQDFSFVFTYNKETKVVSQFPMIVEENHDYQGWESWFQFSPSGNYPFKFKPASITSSYVFATIACGLNNKYCNENPNHLVSVYVLFLKNLDTMIENENFNQLFDFKIGYIDKDLDWNSTLTNTDQDYADGGGCRLLNNE